MSLTFGSLFAGIGGFDMGFERGGAGMKCEWQVEINDKCNAVRKRHWPSVEQFEDVRQFNAKATIQPGLICGGFPCQDLSVAGRRAGLAGERSGLFYEFMRIVAEFSPRWVCIENVPGLLSSNEGRDMGAVVGALGKLGYRWAYRVLDAQYFGLAQRRKRVFIVGSLGTEPHPAKILFDTESLSRNPPTREKTGARVAGSTAYRTSGNCGVMHQGDKTAALNTATDPTQNIVATLNSGGNSGGFRTEPGEHLLAHTLRAEGHDASEDGTGRGTPLVAFDTTQCTSPGNYSNPKPGDPCHPLASGADAPAIARTLTTGSGGSRNDRKPITVDELGVRRLTPRECERLQGFPDDFTRWDQDGNEISDSARYRMLGNAIAVPVAEWIGRRIVLFCDS